MFLYELIWVIYQLDHNLPFDRFPNILELNGIKYLPDFIQNGKIIELKGFESEISVNKKSDVARSKGYDVIVLRKEDLVLEFEYVKAKYKSTTFYELYDGYKPSYSYCCSSCNLTFASDKKKITDTVFCSRTCSGLSRKLARTKVV